MTTAHAKNKQSFYLPDDIIEEIYMEAARLDRSLSWIIQTAWRIAKPQMARLPSQAPEVVE